MVILTADDDAEQDSDNEVPYRHTDHDARDSEVLGLAPSLSSIPNGLFDEVYPKHEHERTDQHNS